MKKLLSVIAMGCLGSLLLVGTAQAQLPGTEIRVSIPFDFTVRGKTLPAGDYEISRIGDEPVDLLMRNVRDKHEHVVFSTEPENVRRVPSRDILVFNRYGDSYFLEEVETAGENLGRELTPSHAERAMRRDMAKNEAEPETVTLAAN